MEDKILKTEHKVRFEDIDLTGKLTVPATVVLAQEAATLHGEMWGAGYDDLRRENSAWVLVRAKYSFYEMPSFGEKFTVETWVNPCRHALYPRFYRFCDEKGKVFMEGGSIWSIYNFAENKAMNPGGKAFEFPAVVLENQPDSPRPVRAAEEENSLVRRVLYSDADGNGHLNNCKYINWAVDILPVDFWGKNSIKTLEISYHAQAPLDKNVTLNYTFRGSEMTINGKLEDTVVFAAKLTFDKEIEK